MTVEFTKDHSSNGIEWTLQYDASCSLFTHPRQLSASALMSDFQPVDPSNARILELGCATGGNLTPIAGSLPYSECIGIDPFAAQIEIAQMRADRSGISNVTYLPIGVSDLDRLEGKFDYIIAHGLFSWISDEHREDTLQLCFEKLNDHGLAYISFNTYPGWHQREIVRNLVCWQKRLLDKRVISEDQKDKDAKLIKESRLALKFFSQNALKQDMKGCRELLAQIETDISKFPDWYLAHEYLLEHNQPLYFERFLELIHAHQLTYLCDASSNVHLASHFLSAMSLRELHLMTDKPLDVEQGIDFLLNRTLRRAIITKRPQEERQFLCPPYVWSEPSKEGVDRRLNQELFVASPYKPMSEINNISDVTSYGSQTIPGEQMIINQPAENVIMILLSTIWPDSLSIDQLMKQSAQLLFEFGREDLVGTLSLALNTLIVRGHIYQPTWGIMGQSDESQGESHSLLPWIRGGSTEQVKNLTNRYHCPVFLNANEMKAINEQRQHDQLKALGLLH